MALPPTDVRAVLGTLPVADDRLAPWPAPAVLEHLYARLHGVPPRAAIVAAAVHARIVRRPAEERN